MISEIIDLQDLALKSRNGSFAAKRAGIEVDVRERVNKLFTAIAPHLLATDVDEGLKDVCESAIAACIDTLLSMCAVVELRSGVTDAARAMADDYLHGFNMALSGAADSLNALLAVAREQPSEAVSLARRVKLLKAQIPAMSVAQALEAVRNGAGGGSPNAAQQQQGSRGGKGGKGGKSGQGGQGRGAGSNPYPATATAGTQGWSNFSPPGSFAQQPQVYAQQAPWAAPQAWTAPPQAAGHQPSQPYPWGPAPAGPQGGWAAGHAFN